MNFSLWSKQNRGDKSGWFGGRQGSSNRRRRECCQGRDRLASRPYEQRSEWPQLHLNLVWRHTPQRRMGHDSSALHSRVGLDYKGHLSHWFDSICTVQCFRETPTGIWTVLGLWNRKRADYDFASGVAEWANFSQDKVIIIKDGSLKDKGSSKLRLMDSRIRLLPAEAPECRGLCFPAKCLPSMLADSTCSSRLLGKILPIKKTQMILRL